MKSNKTIRKPCTDKSKRKEKKRRKKRCRKSNRPKPQIEATGRDRASRPQIKKRTHRTINRPAEPEQTNREKENNNTTLLPTYLIHPYAKSRDQNK
ncbi:uncharacterized protein EAF01_003085 [Botrytis porri]|uniref:uncharacterized protein n=1 Tax=Botrytis porri TaxID=87229 RepID=UPI00190041A0|nr:uncharacterized protein EAF01_003085 [Botrytis porri]KAF7909367.1 hypothetical protein EAF01_003085 [Botrytis porri]